MSIYVAHYRTIIVSIKLAGFVFQSLAGLAPPYLADDCHLASSDRHLHSADTRNLCRSPNKHSVRGQFLKLCSKNMKQSAVFTQTACMA